MVKSEGAKPGDEARSPVVELFPWVSEFRRMCRCIHTDRSMASLTELMQFYVRNVSVSVNECYTRPLRAAKLKDSISETLLLFLYIYRELSEDRDRSAYLRNMSDLLALYVDMELKASRKSKEDHEKICARLTSCLYVYLEHSTEHLLDTLMKIQFMCRSYHHILDPVITKIMKGVPAHPDSSAAYVRYFLIYRLWRKINVDASVKNQITTTALSSLGPPPPVFPPCALEDVLPKVPKCQPNFTKALLQHKFDVRRCCDLFLGFRGDKAGACGEDGALDSVDTSSRISSQTPEDPSRKTVDRVRSSITPPSPSKSKQRDSVSLLNSLKSLNLSEQSSCKLKLASPGSASPSSSAKPSRAPAGPPRVPPTKSFKRKPRRSNEIVIIDLTSDVALEKRVKRRVSRQPAWLEEMAKKRVDSKIARSSRKTRKSTPVHSPYLSVEPKISTRRTEDERSALSSEPPEALRASTSEDPARNGANQADVELPSPSDRAEGELRLSGAPEASKGVSVATDGCRLNEETVIKRLSGAEEPESLKEVCDLGARSVVVRTRRNSKEDADNCDSRIAERPVVLIRQEKARSRAAEEEVVPSGAKDSPCRSRGASDGASRRSEALESKERGTGATVITETRYAEAESRVYGENSVLRRTSEVRGDSTPPRTLEDHRGDSDLSVRLEIADCPEKKRSGDSTFASEDYQSGSCALETVVGLAESGVSSSASSGGSVGLTEGCVSSSVSSGGSTSTTSPMETSVMGSVSSGSSTSPMEASAICSVSSGSSTSPMEASAMSSASSGSSEDSGSQSLSPTSLGKASEGCSTPPRVSSEPTESPFPRSEETNAQGVSLSPSASENPEGRLEESTAPPTEATEAPREKIPEIPVRRASKGLHAKLRRDAKRIHQIPNGEYIVQSTELHDSIDGLSLLASVSQHVPHLNAELESRGDGQIKVKDYASMRDTYGQPTDDETDTSDSSNTVTQLLENPSTEIINRIVGIYPEDALDKVALHVEVSTAGNPPSAENGACCGEGGPNYEDGPCNPGTECVQPVKENTNVILNGETVVLLQKSPNSNLYIINKAVENCKDHAEDEILKLKEKSSWLSLPEDCGQFENVSADQLSFNLELSQYGKELSFQESKFAVVRHKTIKTEPEEVGQTPGDSKSFKKVSVSSDALPLAPQIYQDIGLLNVSISKPSDKRKAGAKGSLSFRQNIKQEFGSLASNCVIQGCNGMHTLPHEVEPLHIPVTRPTSLPPLYGNCGGSAELCVPCHKRCGPVSCALQLNAPSGLHPHPKSASPCGRAHCSCLNCTYDLVAHCRQCMRPDSHVPCIESNPYFLPGRSAVQTPGQELERKADPSAENKYKLYDELSGGYELLEMEKSLLANGGGGPGALEKKLEAQRDAEKLRQRESNKLPLKKRLKAQAMMSMAYEELPIKSEKLDNYPGVPMMSIAALEALEPAQKRAGQQIKSEYEGTGKKEDFRFNGNLVRRDYCKEAHAASAHQHAKDAGRKQATGGGCQEGCAQRGFKAPAQSKEAQSAGLKKPRKAQSPLRQTRSSKRNVPKVNYCYADADPEWNPSGESKRKRKKTGR